MIAIGVDAGGSGTVAAVSRDGLPVREVRGGPANATTLGLPAAAAAIIATMRAALADAEPERIHVGAAGAGRPEVARGLAAAIAAAFPAARVTVGDDAVIALRSAIPTGAGSVLIAGTGSIAYAENGTEGALVGGHGHLLGDEGSAFWIGMAALRRYAHVLDGRAPRDETTDLVARALPAPTRADLHAAVYDRRLDPAAVAGLAPSVIAFAGKGNRVATTIVQAAAKELGDLLAAAIRNAGLAGASAPVALAGGLLRENSLLTFLLETRITGDWTGAVIVRASGSPVTGALRLAQATGAPA
jgi:N-acetylglucosamine kinase-like BadF-type ATPase